MDRKVLSERLSRVGGLWRGLHDGSESDLAGGSEDKEAGTPHQPLLELSSAPANLVALGSSGSTRACPQETHYYCPLRILLSTNSVRLSPSPPGPRVGSQNQLLPVREVSRQ